MSDVVESQTRLGTHAERSTPDEETGMGLKLQKTLSDLLDGMIDSIAPRPTPLPAVVKPHHPARPSARPKGDTS